MLPFLLLVATATALVGHATGQRQRLTESRDCVDGALDELRVCVREFDRQNDDFQGLDGTTDANQCCAYKYLLDCTRLVFQGECGSQGTDGLDQSIADSFVSDDKAAFCRQAVPQLNGFLSCNVNVGLYTTLAVALSIFIILIFCGIYGACAAERDKGVRRGALGFAHGAAGLGPVALDS